MAPFDRLLRARIAGQAGLVTRSQVLRAGLTPKHVDVPALQRNLDAIAAAAAQVDLKLDQLDEPPPGRAAAGGTP